MKNREQDARSCVTKILQISNLGAQLLVQNRNIVIPFSLVEISGNWIAKFIFLGKLANFEASTIITASIG